MKASTTLMVLLFSGMVAKAQEEVSDIITDRPDQTESSSVVPIKKLQVETGFILETDETELIRVQNTTFSTTLFRYGVFENTELRLALEYLGEIKEMRVSGTKSSISGISPLYTGIKVKMTEERGLVPEMSLLSSLTWPGVATDEFKTQYLAPALRFAFAHTLSDRMSLGYNLGAEWDGTSHEVAYYYSLSFGMGLTGSVGMFLESYGTMYDKYKPEHMADAGFTWLILRNLQLDVSGGIGISNVAPDQFIGFGLSYRLPG